MIFNVSHRTTYRYATPVTQSKHVVHLEPRTLPRQTVSRHNLLIEPAPASRFDRIDYFGNPTSILIIEEEHSELVVLSRSTVAVEAMPLIDIAASRPWEQVAAAARLESGALDLAVLQFVNASRNTTLTADVLAFAAPSFPGGRPVLEGAMDLTRRIHAEFEFDPAATDVSTPVSEVLKTRRGVCQDFAHLSLASLRALGLPVRYVSGYLLTRPPPGKTKLQGSDASHAWLSVWTPEFSWIDFDPTNGLMPTAEHITVAYGRDYDDVSPLSGVLLGGSDQALSIAVDVVEAT
jgi:transglutaminase-like putative cysteine protease